MNMKHALSALVAVMMLSGPALAGGWGFAQPTRDASVDITANGGGSTNCSSAACITAADATVNTDAYTNTSPRATGEYEVRVKSGGFGFARDGMTMVTQLGAEGSIVADASRKPATASSDADILIDSIGVGGRVVASQDGELVVRGEATDTAFYDSARGEGGAAAAQHMNAVDLGRKSAAAGVDTIVRVSVGAANNS